MMIVLTLSYPFQTNILKFRIWNWNFVWRFLMLFESLMPNMKKTIFPILIYYRFSFKLNFTLKFLWFFAVLLKSLMQTIKQIYIWKSDLYKLFLYICIYAPEPVGRIDPSSIGRFKEVIEYVDVVNVASNYIPAWVDFLLPQKYLTTHTSTLTVQLKGIRDTNNRVSQELSTNCKKILGKSMSSQILWTSCECFFFFHGEKNYNALHKRRGNNLVVLSTTFI